MTPISFNTTVATAPYSEENTNYELFVFFDEMFNQIQNDSQIPPEEKDLVLQLKNIDCGLPYSQANEMVDRLISAADEKHPYGYFYYFLKAVIQLEHINDKSETVDQELLDQAIAALDKLIELQPNCKEGYLLRGGCKLIKDEFVGFEMGVADIVKAAELGSIDAQKFLASMNLPW
ncbi:MAG: hypothetical protein JSS32_04800 [Verrucomicrobia bacterium]|nr:hypothetical protein [Verrucomicrobiota bacterium]